MLLSDILVTKTRTLPPLTSAVNVVNGPVWSVTDPKDEIYASEPSWVTLSSTISNRLLVESDIDTKYFALLIDEAEKVFRTDVAEEATVVVASAMSEWLRVAPAVANDNVPAPSVLINWFAVPSDVGKVNPLIVTPPVPFPESSKFAFEEFVFTVLSSIVTPVSYTHLTLPTTPYV